MPAARASDDRRAGGEARCGCRGRSRATIAPATPLTKPADRSISPSSSTNTMPMPMVAMAAAWTIRLTKLPAVRKFGFCDLEDDAMMISPRTIGSEPRSPT